MPAIFRDVFQGTILMLTIYAGTFFFFLELGFFIRSLAWNLGLLLVLS